jgi:flagellum-specific peptidoglycan hydrolase FlgJ
MWMFHPGLRPVTLAQWAHECNCGTSRLALEHNNFAGMNYRAELARYAVPVVYTSSDGDGTYAHFHDLKAFIRGYWRFLRRPRYAGWQRYRNDPTGFLQHLKDRGYAEDPDYVGKVMWTLGELRARGL